MVRITFNSINMDLRLRKPGLTTVHEQQMKQNISGSGNIEQINFFGQFRPSVRVYIMPDDWRLALAWRSWARQGKTWAISLDSAKTAQTTLDGAGAAGQKTIPLTSTAGLSVGDMCLIRAEDNDDEFESIKIATVNAGVSVEAEDDLVFSYNSGDTFRHKDYYPSVVSLDKKFNPQLWNRGIYILTIKFAEA